MFVSVFLFILKKNSKTTFCETTNPQKNFLQGLRGWESRRGSHATPKSAVDHMLSGPQPASDGHRLFHCERRYM